MGLADTLGAEPRVEMRVSELKEILKSDALRWAENKCLINGVKAGLPAEHILTMIGENKEGKND